MNRFLAAILFITIVFQLVFSFYYSSEIINQNSQLNQSETEFRKMSEIEQEFEKQLAVATSLTQIKKQLNPGYVEIKQVIDTTK